VDNDPYLQNDRLGYKANGMPRKLFKKITPSVETIEKQKCLGFLGKHLHSPMLWHLNRRSVSVAFAIGLFMMWVPFPSQMVYAAILAILVRANLPISVVLVWITNPVTIPPMFYFAYLFGTKILGTIPFNIEFELTWSWLTTNLSHSWQPFLLGCLLLAIISALIGYVTVQLLSRMHIIRRLRERKLKRQKKLSNK